MWISPVTLNGSTVRLEPLGHGHAPGLHTAAEPELFRFTPQGPREWSVDGFRADIDQINVLADVVAFAVVHQASDTVIGRTTYMDIQPQHRCVEIGRTWLARSHQGTAVNPELKYLMLKHAFEDRSAIRVAFKTAAENLHSQRAIAKLGAVREGTLRQDRIMPNGVARDTVVFSIIDREWPAIKLQLERRISQFAAK